MFQPWKIIDVDLSRPLEDIYGLEGYKGIKLFIRIQGKPIGFSEITVHNRFCSASDIEQKIFEEHSKSIVCHILREKLNESLPIKDFHSGDQLNPPILNDSKQLPSVTVAVCTRNRPDDLKLWLDALKSLDYPNLEILIVDNASEDDVTERLLKTNYSTFRYIYEPRPGLDWARNRAITESNSEIIAFTDDDVIVDQGWVKALAKIFAEDSQVMAVTGLVIPHELETESQELFELNGGFGRGFERKWIQVDNKDRVRWARFGTGQYGTGANMAYRRSLFDKIGYFDTALDVGTATNGGGDLEMFFRVLKEGFLLVYEPTAIVRHRHRRNYSQLKDQIRNNGIGFFSFLVRSYINYPDVRFSLMRLGLWWIWCWNFRRLKQSFLRKNKIPRDLLLAELYGSFLGLKTYQKAYKTVNEIRKKFGDQFKSTKKIEGTKQSRSSKHDQYAIGVRKIALNTFPNGINDVSDYRWVRVYVHSEENFVGMIDNANYHQSISRARLIDAIVVHFWYKLDCLRFNVGDNIILTKAIAHLKKKSVLSTNKTKIITGKLPHNINVSIVISTLDRPDDLRICLQHLKKQKTSRRVEIVVVDNNPASGLTVPVVNEFDDIVLVNESRRGLAYARNAGFTASKGDIVITTDDDVIAPPDWLEKLITPFVRSDVMIVTGNTLPYELETTAQILFEKYGGLGRGFDTIEADKTWFKSFRFCAIPTWELGATANAAFRATIFSHPQIGLMDEALGPGMPSGVGEDTYLFYRVLKAGYTIIYEPTAFVWHKHRRSMSALRHQLYNYGKGHVAYHLTTLFQDKDLRSLVRLLYHLPAWRIKQLICYFKNLVLRNKNYSLTIILIEIIGNLMGPFSLWKSQRRVGREGRSDPYIPISKRFPIKNIQTISESSIKEFVKSK